MQVYIPVRVTTGANSTMAKEGAKKRMEDNEKKLKLYFHAACVSVVSVVRGLCARVHRGPNC